MKYIGTEYSETFFAPDGTPEKNINEEISKRVKMIQVTYPGLSFSRYTYEKIDNTPVSVDTDSGTPAIVTQGRFCTIVMRQKPPAKFYPLERTPGKNLPVSPAVLTKRELIAAMCLQGILASSPGYFEDVERSIKIADEFLKQIDNG